MMKIKFNTKSESIEILSEYFRKFGVQELKYYLDNVNNLTIPFFFNSNVYEPFDVEVKYLFLSHLKIVLKKIFKTKTEFDSNDKIIKISFVSNSIHWNDLFVISNNIFVSVQYLIKIFELIEYNEYNDTNDVYFDDDSDDDYDIDDVFNMNNIYDIGLLKNISNSIYSILQNSNKAIWNEFIIKKFNCFIIPIENIIFKNKYKFLREPNIDYLQDKIIVYWLDSEHIYGTFNSICSSDISFSPYWEKKIISLSYNEQNNTYCEIDSLDFDICNIITNPFEYETNLITNTIITNY